MRGGSEGRSNRRLCVWEGVEGGVGLPDARPLFGRRAEALEMLLGIGGYSPADWRPPSDSSQKGRVTAKARGEPRSGAVTRSTGDAGSAPDRPERDKGHSYDEKVEKAPPVREELPPPTRPQLSG
jgi:hypothetical protein